MRITLLQPELQWESPAVNRKNLQAEILPLAGKTDLVILPEMFTTGFTMRAEVLAEPTEGPTLDWMRDLAHQLNASVTGSFICLENGHFYNRLAWVCPDDTAYFYDKHYLFGMAGENRHYTPGKNQITLEWQGWRVRPLICYDLRFPEWSRNYNADYDLLVYVANWPARRSTHWLSLLTARAIENQCYVAGVNVAGRDGNELEYSGDSTLVDYSGQTLCTIQNKPGVCTQKISLEDLQEYRKKLPFLQDAHKI